MKENKNIDRLFQEQFSHFEQTPNPQVWLNIQADLKKDKKRKVVALWVKYSGIAAVFLVGLFFWSTSQSSYTKIENKNVSGINFQKDCTNTKLIYPKNSLRKTQMVNSFKQDDKSQKELQEANFSLFSPKTKKSVKPFISSKSVVFKKKNVKNDVNVTRNNLAVKELVAIQSNNNSREQNATQDNITNANLLANATNQILEKKSSETSVEPKKLETSNPEPVNELEEILKVNSAQKNALVTKSKNKWQISPNISPLYLNSNSVGSPIDEQLSEYEKKSERSISFGIGVHYAVSKNTVIRTGVNKVVLGYNTNNVLYSTGLAANNLENIKYSSRNVIKFVNDNVYSSLSTSEKEIQSTNIGNLNQKIGYYELPIEVSYALLDKKFGINLIGGFSTLFLNKNVISLESSQSNIVLGEAKNLSQINFSSNIGVGFQYKIAKSFQVKVEPIVKYQLNTFSNNASNFKPLYIGLYSGVIYGF